MNQNEYIIAGLKKNVANLTEQLFALDFHCVLLKEENTKLKARIAELESAKESEEQYAENV